MASSSTARRRSTLQSRLTLSFAVVTAATSAAFGGSEIRRELRASDDWTHDLDAKERTRRERALDRYSIGTEAWPRDVPCAALARRLAEPDVREHARAALTHVVRVGRCLPHVAASLARAADVPTRAAAARVLGSTPRPSRASILPLLIATADVADSSSLAAIVALGQLGDTTLAARRAVSRAFVRGGDAMRVEALDAISRIAPPNEVWSLTQPALDLPNPAVRVAAVSVLTFAEHDGAPRPTLIARARRLLADTSSDVRMAAKQTLRALGAHP